MTDELQPPGQLRIRQSELVDVSFPKRLIELIVVPYDADALVPHPRDPSRIVTESIAPGAFAGIERRANRIRVNRDHLVTRTVGRAVAFHPSRSEGLVADVRIAQTELGDETLTLAEEGCLDASAGFLPMPGGEEWPVRNRMRITKAWLAHIAMTPDPAYAGANVLAVREAAAALPAEPIERPNFDQLRHRDLEELYASIDSRYTGPAS